MTDAAPPVVNILPLAILLVAGLLALVVLLRNPITRGATLAVLGVLLIVLPVLAGFWYLLLAAPDSPQYSYTVGDVPASIAPGRAAPSQGYLDDSGSEYVDDSSRTHAIPNRPAPSRHSTPSWAVVAKLAVAGLAVILSIGLVAAVLVLLRNRATRRPTAIVLGGLLALGAAGFLLLLLANRPSLREDTATVASKPPPKHAEAWTHKPDVASAPVSPSPVPPPPRKGVVFRALVRALAAAADPDIRPGTAPLAESPEPREQLAAAPAAETSEPRSPPSAAEAERPARPKEVNRVHVVISGNSKTTRHGGIERPDWIGTSPRLEGDDYRVTALVGPYATLEERENDTPKALQAALDEYVKANLGPEAVGQVRLSSDELWKRAVKEYVDEPYDGPPGSDQALTLRHLLLKFDKKLQGEIKEQWRRVQNEGIIAGRLQYAGTVLAAVLALLAVVYGGLRIWGRGAFSR